MSYTIRSENGFRGRKSLTVFHPDDSTPAYWVNFRDGSLTNMTVHRGHEHGEVIARITLHKWHKHTDIEFCTPNQAPVAVEMRPEGWPSQTQLVSLPAAPNMGQFKWKTTKQFSTTGLMRTGDLKLEDEADVQIATFERKGWTNNEDGVVRLCVNLLPELMDQVFVTFVAMQERLLRLRQAQAVAASA
jgi:hypothetical protein